jgi:hypothetical protein
MLTPQQQPPPITWRASMQVASCTICTVAEITPSRHRKCTINPHDSGLRVLGSVSSNQLHVDQKLARGCSRCWRTMGEVAALTAAFDTEFNKNLQALPAISACPPSEHDAHLNHYRIVQRIAELVAYYASRLPHYISLQASHQVLNTGSASPAVAVAGINTASRCTSCSARAHHSMLPPSTAHRESLRSGIGWSSWGSTSWL